MAGKVSSPVGKLTLSGGDLAGGKQNPTVDPVQFAVQLLNAIKAPITGNNISAIVGWDTAEGSNAKFNPLDTTLGPGVGAPSYPGTLFNILGTGKYGPYGVMSYQSNKEGINAIAQTLTDTPGETSPTSSYGKIVASLRGNQPAQQTANLVAAGPFGTEPFSTPSATGKLSAANIKSLLGGATLTSSVKPATTTNPTTTTKPKTVYGVPKGDWTYSPKTGLWTNPATGATSKTQPGPGNNQKVNKKNPDQGGAQGQGITGGAATALAQAAQKATAALVTSTISKYGTIALGCLMVLIGFIIMFRGPEKDVGKAAVVGAMA